MRKLAFVLLAALLPFIGWAQQKKKYAPYKTGEVIVKFKSGSGSSRRSINKSSISAPLKSFGITDAKQLMPLTGAMSSGSRRAVRNNSASSADLNLSSLYVLRFDKSQSVEETVEKLKKLSDIEYAEPNYIVKAIGKALEASPLPQLAANEANGSQPFNDPK
jgi:hypothetical protein